MVLDVSSYYYEVLHTDCWIKPDQKIPDKKSRNFTQSFNTRTKSFFFIIES